MLHVFSYALLASNIYVCEAEADMRREKERKEQELKKSPKVEFISGGTQPGQVVGAPKFPLPIPGPKHQLL